MERYSIFDPAASIPGPPVPPAPRSEVRTVAAPASVMHFPAEDGAKSLSEMAIRDLNATLQLLAERAQYITGASGAAIALREGNAMVCRASSGESAPGLGSQLQVDLGLTGESVRTKQILRCDDAASDTRVNQEGCKALGIASVVVLPLIREGEVVGVFELLSERTFAFEERDIVAMQRLAEMINVAVDLAEAAKKAEQGFHALDETEDDLMCEVSLRQAVAVAPQVSSPVPRAQAAPEPSLGPATLHAAVAPLNPSAIGKCEACGFPVSGGRKLCVDCETARGGLKRAEYQPAFLSNYEDARKKENWISANR